MELIRKKIGQMEEKNQTRTALAIDRDDAIVTVQKLQRKVERLKHALESTPSLGSCVRVFYLRIYAHRYKSNGPGYTKHSIQLL